MKQLFITALFLLNSLLQLSAQVSIVKWVDWYLYPQQLTKIGNSLYFVASTEPAFVQLWKSDGTASGTVLLKNFPNNSFHVIENLTDVNGKLFFVANTDSEGHELWKSDGSSAGTVLVKDIFPGTNSSEPDELTALGSGILFVCDDGIHGRELWKSDGSAAGTTLIKDFVFGPNDGVVQNLCAINNQVFFSAGSYVFHDFSGLYKSDGSVQGTQLVKHFSEGTPSTLRNVTGKLFFTLAAGFDNGVVWKSDGTEAGTQIARTMCGDISQLENVNGTLFLGADDCINNPNANYELCKIGSNASNSGLVKDICVNGSSGAWQITALGSRAYFTADDCLNGEELWRSDGTASGTVIVKNIRYGYQSSYPTELTASNGLLYFTADPGDETGNVTGRELWRSDGTEAGTFIVKDIRPGADGSEPKELTDVNNTLFFVAFDEQNNWQLWRTGGAVSSAEAYKPASYLKVYPTLAQDWISVEFPGQSEHSQALNILDATGRLCLQTDADKVTQIDIHSLHPGAYFISNSNGVIARFFKI
ncbi:MAG: ELWxxDGT repeat protein [Bacteroidota bacterium]